MIKEKNSKKVKSGWQTALPLLFTLLFSAFTTSVQAQGTDLKQLERDMYRYYSASDKERFTKTVEQLKEAARNAGEERLFYKAWANQAIFNFNHVGRNQGLEMAKAEREYAEQHQSKFGLYTSTIAYATMLSNFRMFDQAEKGFREALDYQHRFFPDESAAACYLGLCKVYFNRHQSQKVLECADHALAEPGVIMQHRLTAWSYKCLTYCNGALANVEAFGKAYAEREKVKALYGHDDSFGELVDLYYAENTGDHERVLELAQRLKAPSDRLNMISRAYSLKGDYRQAYLWQKRYKEYTDSANSAEVQKQSSEYALQLDVARAENEAKDLRLANQTLELENMSNELKQQRLSEEALELSLRNQEIALQNAAVRQKNDSLDRHNKDLQLREAEASLAAQRSAERSHHIILSLLGILAALVISGLAFYLRRRRQQLQQLREAYEKLEETTMEKERIGSELRIARNIQMGMVPSVFPAFPERHDIDLYGLMVPAREVGGDLYDFFLDGERLCFCIGDVSGKGVPASMTMAVAVNLFRTIAKKDNNPAHVAQRLNEALSRDNDNGVFVTMFIGIVNLATGRLDYCNCGHNPPVVGTDGQYRYLEMAETNAPIGLWPELEFVGEHLDDISGLTLLLYTDGVTEAEDARQEQFSEDRLLHVLGEARQPLGERVPKSRSRYLVERVKLAVEAFVNGAEPSDDLTMLCLKTEITKNAYMRKELTIKNQVQELERVTAFVDEIGHELGLSNELLMNLQLVLEETVSNVIFYAHPEGTQADIMITAESDGHELTFVLSDQGREFDPTLKEDTDITINPAEREIGGLGIFIVKNIMNEVTYQRLEGRNLLTMRKSIK